MKRQVLIYKAFERFWHWMQAILVLMLALTGFEIHGSFRFFGYENAVSYHKISSVAFIILIVFAIFWHFSTGEWRQYVPSARHLLDYLNYYTFGIFRNAPHPTKKTVLSKLNPLQKLVYFFLKVVLIPLMVVTGLLYLFYRYPQGTGMAGLEIESLAPIAVLHTLGAFLLIAFLIAHLYLITTGEKITTNLKAMITGWEDIEDGQKEVIFQDEQSGGEVNE